jgi:hypothetical protein
MDKKYIAGICRTGKIDLKNIVLAGIGNSGLESLGEDKPKIVLFVDDSTDTKLVGALVREMGSDMIMVSSYNRNDEASETNFLESAFENRPYSKDLTAQLGKINLQLANIPYSKPRIGAIIIPKKTKMIGVLSARPYSELSIPDMKMNKCYSEILEEDMSMYSDLDNTRDYMKKFSPRKTVDKRNMIKRR